MTFSAVAPQARFALEERNTGYSYCDAFTRILHGGSPSTTYRSVSMFDSKSMLIPFWWFLRAPIVPLHFELDFRAWEVFQRCLSTGDLQLYVKPKPINEKLRRIGHVLRRHRSVESSATTEPRAQLLYGAVESLRIKGYYQKKSPLIDFSRFTELWSVRLHRFAHVDISTLSSSVKLRELDVQAITTLELEPLRQHPTLRSISLHCNGVASISPLASCNLLTSLDLRNAHNLQSLEPLKGHPSLRTLSVQAAPISDLQPLISCTALETLAVCYCRNLTSLHTLQAHPTLRRLNAAYSSLRDINGVQTCSKLEALCLDACHQLMSIEPLSRHPSLRSISMKFLKVADATCLATCGALEEADLTHCVNLTTVPFTGQNRTLRQLSLSETSIVSLDGLSRCTALEALDISFCRDVASLDALSGLSCLKALDVSGTAVEDLTPLQRCTALEVLLLRRARRLTSIAPLQGHPSLCIFDSAGTFLRDLTPISTLPNLVELSVIDTDLLLSCCPPRRRVTSMYTWDTPQ